MAQNCAPCVRATFGGGQSIRAHLAASLGVSIALVVKDEMRGAKNSQHEEDERRNGREEEPEGAHRTLRPSDGRRGVAGSPPPHRKEQGTCACWPQGPGLGTDSPHREEE